MKLENQKTTRRHFEFAFASALAGIGGGVLALGFAVVLWLVESMLPLAIGAACYGVALLWLGWSVGKTARRESATYVSDEEER